jgi:NTP pyrophosphatase (non-canonical NTP hydrolase)
MKIKENSMEIKEFQNLIKELYVKRDNKRGIDKNCLWLMEEVGELAKAVRKNDVENIEEEIADVIAWTFSIANVMDLDVEKLLEKKYKDNCYYCNDNPCVCDKQ